MLWHLNPEPRKKLEPLGQVCTWVSGAVTLTDTVAAVAKPGFHAEGAVRTGRGRSCENSIRD